MSAKDLYCAAGPCRAVDLGRVVGLDGGLCVAGSFDGGRAFGAFLLANWNNVDLEKNRDWLLHCKDRFGTLIASSGSNEGALGDRCRMESGRNIAAMELLSKTVSRTFRRSEKTNSYLETVQDLEDYTEFPSKRS